MGKRMAKFKKGFVDLFSGDILLRKRVDRHMGFVFYIFVLFCAIIAWSLYVEKQLVKVEQNTRTIEALEVSYHQRSIELVSLDQRTKIESMLEACKSELKAPVEPAKVIRRK